MFNEIYPNLDPFLPLLASPPSDPKQGEHRDPVSARGGRADDVHRPSDLRGHQERVSNVVCCFFLPWFIPWHFNYMFKDISSFLFVWLYVQYIFVYYSWIINMLYDLGYYVYLLASHIFKEFYSFKCTKSLVNKYAHM